MRSNREKNQEHAARADARVRPAPKDYDFTALEAVLRRWRSL
jgi:hypothetical protein